MSFWLEASEALGIDPATRYDSFHCGGTASEADRFAGYSLDGPKRASTALVAEMAYDGDAMPGDGSYWVVTGSIGQPLMLIRTCKIEVAAFVSANEGFAWDEGEGDRSLRSWRADHIEYFGRSCCRIGIEWSEELDTVFERFEVLWPAHAARRRVLRSPYTSTEWAAYHELRRTELFNRYLPNVEYDPLFAENWAAGVFHQGVFAAGEFLACLQIDISDMNEASFHLVAVQPALRGRGIGRFLLAEGERFARVNGRSRLRVFAEPQALGFYRSLGFVDGPDWARTPASEQAVALKKQLA